MTDRPTRTVVLTKAVGSPFCVAIDDGNLVHTAIASALDSGELAIVSFEGVKRLTTAFLNAAIGQLYNEYSDEIIRDLLRVTDASQEDLRLLKRVIDNAKQFFSDPARGSEVLRKLSGDE